MTQPARRGRGAIAIIMGTVMNVLTLPLRLIGQLFGRSGRRSRTIRPVRPRRTWR